MMKGSLRESVSRLGGKGGREAGREEVNVTQKKRGGGGGKVGEQKLLPKFSVSLLENPLDGNRMGCVQMAHGWFLI